ncbi:MAG TPA: TPM domain-containing protein [Candidatus Binataceae bacterium]|nr:TPM domain-containing protein [Candidatus Binataceae bacterium]
MRLRNPRLQIIAASLVASLFALAAGARADQPRFPALAGRVVDEAGILSQPTIDLLTDMVAGQEKKTGQQLVVVTLSSLQGYSIEDFGYQLGRHWGIGQKGINNGVLLIVAPHERKVRIEVGYGLEGVLTDAQCSQIIQQVILPEFRRGDFDAGVLKGTRAILQVIGGEPAKPSSSRSAGPLHFLLSIFEANFASLFVFFFFLILFAVFAQGFSHLHDRDWWRQRKKEIKAAKRRRYRYWQFHVHPGGPGYGFGRGYSGGGYPGGGFSGGGFSGGGFSGGGGSFGGGGASGSW